MSTPAPAGEEPDFAAIVAGLRHDAISAAASAGLPPPSQPAHPDQALLDLAEQAMEARDRERQAMAAFGERMQAANAPNSGLTNAQRHAAFNQGHVHREAYEAASAEVRRILRAANKLPATTGAGVYAKAIMMRLSKTGAGVLAHSLAEDLLGNPDLRRLLHPPVVL